MDRGPALNAARQKAGRRRFRAYLGLIRNFNRIDVALPTDHAKFFLATSGLTEDLFVEQVRRVKPKHFDARGETKLRERVYPSYARPLVEMLASKVHLRGKAVAFTITDVSSDLICPTVSKARLVRTASCASLLRLNADRHWGPLEQLPADIPYDEKEDRLVFRGSTTGDWRPPEAALRLCPRKALFERYETRQPADFDLGFWNVAQHAERLRDRIEGSTFWRGRMEIAEQLRCKFLLCLEGNDVATSLKWMLGSNSVVLTHAPTMEGWLLESRLTPWEHYVPVARDLSNLEARVRWCRAHPEECKTIAANARAYVAGFLDLETEEEIALNVLTAHVERVAFSDPNGLYGPIEAENFRGAAKAVV